MHFRLRRNACKPSHQLSDTGAVLTCADVRAAHKAGGCSLRITSACTHLSRAVGKQHRPPPVWMHALQLAVRVPHLLRTRSGSRSRLPRIPRSRPRNISPAVTPATPSAVRLAVSTFQVDLSRSRALQGLPHGVRRGTAPWTCDRTCRPGLVPMQLTGGHGVRNRRGTIREATCNVPRVMPQPGPSVIGRGASTQAPQLPSGARASRVLLCPAASPSCRASACGRRLPACPLGCLTPVMV